jgi:hypothetical protein
MLGGGSVSKAKTAFLANVADVDRLLEIHEELTGAAVGRRHKVEVLNKAAIVLISAFWESYCEDLLSEELLRLVARNSSVLSVPKELRLLLSRNVRKSLDERAPWRLAGKGWRKEITAIANTVSSDMNFLNTPKTKQIDGIFKLHLGIDVSRHWHWTGMTASNASKKLDNFVSLRGDVAHRGRAKKTVSKLQVLNFLNHAKRLVDITDTCVVGEIDKLAPKRKAKKTSGRRRTASANP